MSRLHRRVSSRFAKGSAGRAIATVSVGSAAGQGALILATPFLARMYGPSPFGVFAWVSTIGTILALIATLRLEMAIPRAADDREVREILSGASFVCLAFTALLALATIVVGSGSAGGLDFLGSALYLIAPTMLVTAVFTLYSQVVVRAREYGAIASRGLTSALVTVSVQGLLGLRWATSVSLIVGLILGRAGSSLGLVRASGIGFCRPKLSSAGGALTRWSKLAAYGALGATLNAVAFQLPVILTGIWFGAVAAGYVGVAWRVLSLPAAVISSSVASVLLGEFTAAESGSALRRKFNHAFWALVPFGFAIAVLGASVGPRLFEAILGPQWAEVGEVVRLLSLPVAVGFIAGPLAQALVFLEHHGLYLVLNALTVFGMWAVGFASHEYGLDFIQVVAVMAGALTVSYATQLLLSIWAVRRGRAGP